MTLTIDTDPVSGISSGLAPPVVVTADGGVKSIAVACVRGLPNHDDRIVTDGITTNIIDCRNRPKNSFPASGEAAGK